MLNAKLYKNTKNTLLIADLHLDYNEVAKTNLFIDFCRQQALGAEQVFILGDLFNVWLGDDLSIAPYKTVINELKNLTQTTKVFVMSGNRDFLLGPKFEKASGCKLIKDPYLLEINTKKYVLTHGDKLCTDDISYQCFRIVLHNPLIKFIFLSIPQQIRLKFLYKLRDLSIKAKKHKTSAIMDVNHNSVNKFMQKYPNADLIHGHTHRSNTHFNKNFIRYVLADWSASTYNAISINKDLNWLKVS